jgi:hypothetical protein
VESWLVSYVNKNEDIEDTVHQLSIHFRYLESALFDIKVRKEIIVAPIRDYIKNLLKYALTKITKSDQEELVATHHGILVKEITKGTLESR